MIHEPFQIDAIPKHCEALVVRFERGKFVEFDQLQMTRESAWTGERLFLGYFWRNESAKVIADFRFQVFPLQKEIFIGLIEIHSGYQGKGFATALVAWLENSVALEQGDWKIRLFAQKGAAGFWERLGYERESDVRFLTKEIT